MDLFAPRIKTTIASLRNVQTGLPARIAAFNAEANGATLTVPDDTAGYVVGGLPRHQADAFPVVEVAIPDAVVDNLSIQHIEGDLSSSVVVAVWAGKTSGQDFPAVYEQVLGYARCITEVLLVPEAIYPRETVDRIRYAFAANPDQRDRGDMETFTFGGFMFFTTAGLAQRP